MKKNFWLVVAIYFLISWLVPWYKIPTEISVSYIFDAIFIVAILRFFNIKFIVKPHLEKKFFFSLISTVTLAALSILAVGFYNLPTPFHLVENATLHLLLFAPLIEEFLFRIVFSTLAHRAYSKKISIFTTALIFSLSHAPALWFLPPVFHTFIYVQLVYTFILGLILTQEFQDRLDATNVILLHFLFNLMFLLAIKTNLI